MPFLEATGVSLDYPIYDAQGQTLRGVVFSRALGGTLIGTQKTVRVIRALEAINIKIRDGERVGIVGHNGAGKTTLLKVLGGIYAPTTGAVSAVGKVVSSIAFGAGIDPELDGISNIKNLARLRLVPSAEIKRRLDDIVEFSGLAQFINLPVRTYSSGMVARLAFAVATEFEVDILLLDEWMGAGDADFQEKATKRMQEFVNRARIVVLSTHNEGLVRQFCSRVLGMKAGRIIYDGAAAGWYEQPR